MCCAHFCIGETLLLRLGNSPTETTAAPCVCLVAIPRLSCVCLTSPVTPRPQTHRPSPARGARSPFIAPAPEASRRSSACRVRSRRGTVLTARARSLKLRRENNNRLFLLNPQPPPRAISLHPLRGALFSTDSRVTSVSLHLRGLSLSASRTCLIAGAAPFAEHEGGGPPQGPARWTEPVRIATSGRRAGRPTLTRGSKAVPPARRARRRSWPTRSARRPERFCPARARRRRRPSAPRRSTTPARGRCTRP